MRRSFLNIILLVFTMVLFTSCSIRKHIPEGKMILKKNKVEIESKDVDFTKYDISKYIAQSENNKILGIMPLTWVYYKTDNRPNSKLLSWINRTVGDKPTYYDNELLDKSIVQISNYLNNIGYFNSTKEPVRVVISNKGMRY